MEKSCNNCRWYDVTWTNNTNGLYFMSNSRLKHYCSKEESPNYNGGITMAKLDIFEQELNRNDSCNLWKRN